MLPWFGMIYLMRSVLACFREITDLGSQLDGSVAEWSKALVLGTSLFVRIPPLPYQEKLKPK